MKNNSTNKFHFITAAVSFLFLFSVQLSAQSFFTTDMSMESPFLLGNTALTKTKQSDALNFPGSTGTLDLADFGYSYFEQPLNNQKLVSHSGFLLATLHPIGNHFVGVSYSELQKDSSANGRKTQLIYSFSIPMKFYQQRLGFSLKYNLLDHFSDGTDLFDGADFGLDAGYFQTDIFPEWSLKKDQHLEGGIRFGITVKNLLQYSELQNRNNKKDISVIRTAPDFVLGIGYLPVNTETYSVGIGYSFSTQENSKTKFEMLKSNESKRKSNVLSGSVKFKKWSLDLSMKKWSDETDNQNTLAFGYSISQFRFFTGRSYFADSSIIFFTCQMSLEQKMH